MPATREEVINFLADDNNGFSQAEKWIVKMQYKGVTHPGNFEEKLWELMCAADADNLAKIGLAFPIKAHAFWSWTNGDLEARIRASGLNI